MGIPARKITRLLIDHDPASPEFREGVRDSLRPQLAAVPNPSKDLDLFHDVFVQRPLPWGRFLQSAILHTAAVALIWAVSLAWLRQQRLLDPKPFDRSSLITYTPEENLPPLDTGSAEPPKTQAGDPVFAKQPIISVPREADNRSQTIVAPPDLKLTQDVPMPNIIATGTIAPSVPLDATSARTNRLTAPDTQVVEAAPDADFARDRTNRTALKSDIVPPPPDVTADRHRVGMAGPDAAIIEPPPNLSAPARGRASNINIGPSEVVAPAPQLALSEQHALSSRRGGLGKDPLPGAVQPVAAPPSMGSGRGGNSQGRLIALGINPVAPTGPVPVPSGNRRGNFAAGPQGRPGASGTPESSGSTSNGGAGSKGHNNGSLPAGLHVGTVPGASAAIQRNGASGDSNSDPREMASLSSSNRPGANGNQHAAAPVSDDKVTDVDRQVFGDRHFYAMTLNMPNLNSSTGSWVIRFAELQNNQKPGELLAPVPTEKTDPGYPLELIRSNVHGSVTLYAVIHSDGKVGDVRVLSSPDDRLDNYAKNALSRWKFLPAMKEGKPVPLEAVVVIPFRVRKAF